jgi:hypothetical protein
MSYTFAGIEYAKELIGMKLIKMLRDVLLGQRKTGPWAVSLIFDTPNRFLVLIIIDSDLVVSTGLTYCSPKCGE